MSKASGAETFAQVPIGDVESYWDRRPCNIRHSQEPIGTRAYFDAVEERKYRVEPHIPGFAQFDRWNGKRVLEIGCGIGTDTINFARAGATVTAVDLSSESLRIAKRRAEVFGLADRITFYRANAEELPSVVPVEPYDLIYSFGVIHHTPHPENVLKNLHAYTSPETVVKLMVYNRLSYKTIWIALTYGKGQFWRFDEIVARYSEAQENCPVTYSYSANSFARLLQQTGYRVQESSVDHIFSYVIEDYVKYRYRKVWYFNMMPAWIFRWLERRFGWHLLVEARPVGAQAALAAPDTTGTLRVAAHGS